MADEFETLLGQALNEASAAKQEQENFTQVLGEAASQAGAERQDFGKILADAGGEVPASATDFARGLPTTGLAGGLITGARLLLDTPGNRSFVPSIGRGALNVVQAGAGATAAGAKALGADQTVEKALEFAHATQALSNNIFPSERLSFDELMERGTISDYITYAAETLGEQVPIVGSIVLSGGGGALIGSMAARGALSASQAAALTAKFAAGGAAAGAFTGTTALETGFTALEQAEATGDIYPGVALGAGAAKGALELAVPFAIANRLGLTRGVAGRLTSRIEETVDKLGLVGFALGSAAGESATEALQEAIDIAARSFVDENYDALGPEAASRIREAAAAGALGGLVFGGGAGAIGRGKGKYAPQTFDTYIPPSEFAVQAQVAREGDQLELFLGTDLGITQPGVEQIEAGRRLNEQLTLLLEGGQGQAPKTVDPRQLNLFDMPVQETLAPENETLPFAEVAQAVPETGRLVLPRGAVVQEGQLLHFQAPGEVTREMAQVPQGTQQVYSLGDTTTLRQGEVSGDALALLANPDVQYAGEVANRAEAMDSVQRAREHLEGGRTAMAQEEFKHAFELGARIPPTPTSGYLVPASAELEVRENLPSPALFFGDFIPGELGQSAAPRSHDLNSGGTTSEAVDLGLLEPGQMSAVNMNTRDVSDMLQAVRNGNFSRAREHMKKAGISLSGTEKQQRESLNLLANVEFQQLQQVFQELHQQGLAFQELRTGAPVSIRGKIPAHAIISLPRLTKPQNAQPGLPFRSVDRSDGVKNLFSLVEHNPLTPEKLQPGKAVMVGAEGNDAWFAEVEKQYNVFMKRLGSKATLVIHRAGSDPALAGTYWDTTNSGSSGLYYPQNTYDGVHVIWIAPQKSSREAFLETAIHEFGHFIATTEFAKADSDVHALAVSAFQRSLRAAQVRPASEVLTEALTGGLAEYVGQYKRENLHDALENLNDWYGFDEWFAEQVVRWSATSKTAQTVLTKHFQSVGRTLARILQQLYKAFGVKVDTTYRTQASPEMQKWLDSIFEGRRGKAPPQKRHAVKMVREEDSATNADVLEPLQHPFPSFSPSSKQAKTALKTLGKNMPATQRKKLMAQLDKYNQIIKWGWNVLQLADQNQHIAGLQRYVENLDGWYNLKMRWIARTDARVKEWNNLGKMQADALGRFIFDIAEMQYLSPGEKPRHPSPQEVVNLTKKHKISDEAFQVYLQIVGDFKAVIDQLETTLVREAQQAFANNTEMLQAKIIEIKTELDQFRSRPYFPFSRFGDWTIVVRSQKTGKVIFMQQFESKLARDRAAKEVRKQYPKDLLRLDKMPEEVEIFRGLPLTMLRRLEERLELTQDQKEWLDVLLYDSAPSQGFRQKLRKRAGIAGYSYDAVRAYANYFFHGANHIARIDYLSPLEESIKQVQDEANSLALVDNIDVSKRRQIIDFMRNHLNTVMTPANDWAALRSVAFQWYLGFNPSSALVNFTQIPMVAAPYLAARFNSDLKAMNELKAASLDIHKIYNMKAGKVDPIEMRSIELGIQQGFLDESQATELAGVSEGSNLQRTRAGSAALRLVRQSAYWSAWMFQSAEKINRRVVFRAAHRLAMKDPQNTYLQDLMQANSQQVQELQTQGWQDAEIAAFLAGKDAVRRSQFEYAQWARPRFMQGKKGTLFAFFMYMQNMVWFARYSPGRGRYLLLLLATAGLLGMPGAEDLKDFIKFAARQFGSDFDPEKEARELLVDWGVEKPDLILHGISRYGFGMAAAGDAVGLPIPSVDMSGRLGMGRLIPGMEALGSPQRDFNAVLGGGAADIAGAAYNIPINVMKAMHDNHPDFFKRWERAMPTALGNLSKASRFLREGEERNRAGAAVVEFDVNDPQELAEVVARGLGFVPTRLSQKWDATIAAEEASQYWATRRGMLMQQYDWVRLVQNEPEGMADMRKAIQRFNTEVPVPALRITGQDLSRSLRERERRRAMFEQGLPANRRDIPLAREINRLYPEGQEEPIEVAPAKTLK